ELLNIYIDQIHKILTIMHHSSIFIFEKVRATFTGRLKDIFLFHWIRKDDQCPHQSHLDKGHIYFIGHVTDFFVAAEHYKSLGVHMFYDLTQGMGHAGKRVPF
ncbi:hypothetical protein ACJX0J_022181, partial [Zea mays]